MIILRNDMFFTAITASEQLIQSKEFLNRNRLEPTFFTRKRKMDFPHIVMFLLNFLKLTLQVELIKFNTLFLKHDACISKGAFSRARRKISYLAFRELFELTSKLWLKSDDFRLYKGHRIFAIDGSCIQLPKNSPELLKDFGTSGKSGKAIRARASILCEVLDGVVVHSEFEPIRSNERTLALKHIAYFDEYATENDIIIFDRGYPSHELITKFESKKWKYLMRIPKGFNAGIDRCSESDFIQEFVIAKVKYSIRVLKFALPSGEIEKLITNISSEAFKQEDFVSLYFLRWPIETKYNTVKNKLFLESFSGKTTISVKQDFYSTMYLSNIVTFAKLESDQIINKNHKEKSLKYQYQTNESILIGILKNELILAFLCRSLKKRKQLLSSFVTVISRNRSEIRPGRHFQRPPNLVRWGNSCKNKVKTSI